MKVTIEFNLPEDKDDYEIHTQALGLYCSLNEHLETLRSKLKYETLTDVEYEIVEKIRDEFIETLNSNKVFL